MQGHLHKDSPEVQDLPLRATTRALPSTILEIERQCRGEEGSRDFVEKTYNFKTRDHNEPLDRWIGTTTFYLKPKVMKVQFQRPEIIDISPEGEGWRFVVQKRHYDRRYKTTEDCPLSDPDDSNDALENALFLESAVNGMKLGVRVTGVVEGKAFA